MTGLSTMPAMGLGPAHSQLLGLRLSEMPGSPPLPSAPPARSHVLGILAATRPYPSLQPRLQRLLVRHEVKPWALTLLHGKDEELVSVLPVAELVVSELALKAVMP